MFFPVDIIMYATAARGRRVVLSFTNFSYSLCLLCLPLVGELKITTSTLQRERQ